VNQQHFVYFREASEYGSIGGDLLAHFDEGADDIDARKSACSFQLDADAPLRNSSTDQKEEQRFLAWQKVAVGRRSRSTLTVDVMETPGPAVGLRCFDMAITCAS
jgi:hypothetical protein